MSSRIAMWVQLTILYAVALSPGFLHVEESICKLPIFPSEASKVQYASVLDEDLDGPDRDQHVLEAEKARVLEEQASTILQDRWGLLNTPPEQQPEMSQSTPPASGESPPSTPLWLLISQAPQLEWIGQGQGRIRFGALSRFVLSSLH